MQENVLVVAAKKAVAEGKLIEKHCKYALEKAESAKSLAQPELKAASVKLAGLKRVLSVQSGARKKYAAINKKTKNSKEIYKQFKFIDEAFASAEKTLVATMKAIAVIK